jgi:N-acyl-L-homoserine lactone synthetase
MLHYLNGSDLKLFPTLLHTMLQDRKSQFVDRLGWPLKTTEQYEMDEYDRPDAIYIVCSSVDGRHKGSMRLLPTIGDNMVRDHFSHVIPGISFKSKHVWECSRFCVAPTSEANVAKSLLAGAAKFMRENKLKAFLGVFDGASERVYRRFGSPPFVIGTEQSSAGKLSVGLWRFDERKYDQLVESSLYTRVEYDKMYELFHMNLEKGEKEKRTA